MTESILDEHQCADLLRIKLRTLREWRYQNSGPPFVRITKQCIRYRMKDVEKWMEERLVDNQ